jgi:hypothetical protein
MLEFKQLRRAAPPGATAGRRPAAARGTLCTVAVRS